MLYKSKIFLFIMFIFILSGCKKKVEENNIDKGTGHIEFSFVHYLKDKPLEKDIMQYFNAAGNPHSRQVKIINARILTV